MFVCTGNRFRSPMGAAFFRQAVGDQPVRVSSLGTLDLGAIPPLPEALVLGRQLGVDLSTHRTRTLTGHDLSQADLVLGFERMHLITALVEGRARLETVFTLPELLSLLDGVPLPQRPDPFERARAALAHAHRRRPANPELLGRPELADPIGGSEEVYRKTAQTLREQTQQLVPLLFGSTAVATQETG